MLLYASSPAIAAGSIRAADGCVGLDSAAAARSNASIYQWKRVDLEVRRIAAAQKQVEQSSATNADLATRVVPLSEAVRTLRAGSQSHDSAKTQATADRVASLCIALLH